MTSEARFNADYTAKMQARNMTELLAAILEQQHIANLIAVRDILSMSDDTRDDLERQIREGLGL